MLGGPTVSMNFHWTTDLATLWLAQQRHQAFPGHRRGQLAGQGSPPRRGEGDPRWKLHWGDLWFTFRSGMWNFQFVDSCCLDVACRWIKYWSPWDLLENHLVQTIKCLLTCFFSWGGDEPVFCHGSAKFTLNSVNSLIFCFEITHCLNFCFWHSIRLQTFTRQNIRKWLTI